MSPSLSRGGLGWGWVICAGMRVVVYMKIIRNPDILWREEDDSKAEAYAGLSKGEKVDDIGTSVLFADGIMMSLNMVGTEIWKRCDGRSVEDIVSDLAGLFEVEPAELRADVLEFLAELEKKGFINHDHG
jgi:pyrroloquinoline quinone biosynthesis protein D